MANFNPRSPDGERLHLIVDLRHRFGISIHAPRMGSDYMYTLLAVRLSMISIHAPRMGSDWFSARLLSCCPYFNPRSPDGERHNSGAYRRVAFSFQSTLPGWGATLRSHTLHCIPMNFNPRSPDGERPGNADMASHHITYFNPRSPDGERPVQLAGATANSGYFNPRSPDGERPRKWTSSPTIWAKSSIFNTDCIADRR